jgi:hypothetical protein
MIFMETDIIAILTGLSESHRFPLLYCNYNKESLPVLNSIEEHIAVVVPADYKLMMLNFGPCTLKTQEEAIRFISVASFLSHMLLALDKTGKAFVIAIDDRGFYYFYDVFNKSGNGFYSLLKVHKEKQDWLNTVFVSKNLTDFFACFNKKK